MKDITKGYLRLFRQMLEWEWYDNPNVKAIFLHCLLSANVKSKKWRDMTIKRGQFVTSYEKLAAANGLTNQQTRTALKSLQLTNEIEYQSTNQYTVITVKNFNLYQADNIQKSEADIYPNNKREGGQITTTNKDDNSNTCYINSSSSSSITEEEEEILKKYSKEKNKIKYFGPWLRKITKNGDLKEVLEKAKRWQKNKKEAANELNKMLNPPNEEQATEEELAAAQERARKIIDEVRRK